MIQDFLTAGFVSESPERESGANHPAAWARHPPLFARGGDRQPAAPVRPGAPAPSGDAAADYAITPWQELELSLDPDARALWCYMNPRGAPSFTPSMVRELKRLHVALHKSALSGRKEDLPQYYVMGSRLEGIYNLGGDLAFLLERIRAGDKAALTSYAHGCVEAVHAIYTGFGGPVISIGLVEGNALGGGLEGALCFHTLVAERGVKMGFPEVLFGSFPGMGAYSFLTRKIGAKAAHDMILNGRIYSSEDFFDMGVVDVLAARGEGRNEVSKWIQDNNRRHNLLSSLNRARYRVSPVELEELRDVTDMWVDTTLALDASDLRRMERLLTAQQRQARAR